MAIVKELLILLKQKSLKEIFFGNVVKHSKENGLLLKLIKKDKNEFRKRAGRKGYFIRRGFIHKGSGDVYLVSRNKKESILLFDNYVKIQSGPDLYVYLSTVNHEKGKILNLGLLKGTKGGQAYIIKKPISELKKYKSVVIYCKQFTVLFTYATLK